VRALLILFLFTAILPANDVLSRLPEVPAWKLRGSVLYDWHNKISMRSPPGWQWYEMEGDAYACVGRGSLSWFLVFVEPHYGLLGRHRKQARSDMRTMITFSGELLAEDQGGVFRKPELKYQNMRAVFWETDQLIMVVAPVNRAGKMYFEVGQSMDSVISLGEPEVNHLPIYFQYRFLGYGGIWLTLVFIGAIWSAALPRVLFNAHRWALVFCMAFFMLTLIGVVQYHLDSTHFARALINGIIFLPAIFYVSKRHQAELDADRPPPLRSELEALRVIVESNPENLHHLERYWSEALAWGEGIEFTNAAAIYIREMLARRDLEEALHARDQYREKLPRGRLPTPVLIELVDHAHTGGYRDAVTDLLGELQLRTESLTEKQRRHLTTIVSGRSAAPAEPRPLARTLRLMPARLAGLHERSLELVRPDGGSSVLPFDQITEIAAGVVQIPDQPATLILDLILDGLDAVPEKNRVLRLDSRTTDLSRIVPGKTRLAWTSLTSQILARSKAKPRPNREAVIGPDYARFAGIQGYTRAIYPVSPKT